MAAGNSFITYVPDTRYGGDTAQIGAIYAQRFTMPGSGTFELTHIGVYSWGFAADDNVVLAVFTDDAVEGCPEVAVANSTTTGVAAGGTGWRQFDFTYSTRPQVTGGVVYWIVAFCDNDSDTIYSAIATGGTAVSGGGIYPTFPSGDLWHAYGDRTFDCSLYAVYQAAAVDVPIAPGVGLLRAVGAAPTPSIVSLVTPARMIIAPTDYS